MTKAVFRAKDLSGAPGATLRAEPPVRLNGPLDIRSDFSVGAFTMFGRLVDVQSATVGRYCTIGLKSVLGGTHHPSDWMATHGFQYRSGLFAWNDAADDYEPRTVAGDDADTFRRAGAVIGNDVWLGANVIVLRGVTIGDGAIVGAGSVVTRDVAPYAVVAGSPARVLRHRFEPDLAERLRALRWWDYSPNQLSGVPFDDPEAAIVEVRRRIEAGMQPYRPDLVEVVPDRAPQGKRGQGQGQGRRRAARPSPAPRP